MKTIRNPNPGENTTTVTLSLPGLKWDTRCPISLLHRINGVDPTYQGNRSATVARLVALRQYAVDGFAAPDLAEWVQQEQARRARLLGGTPTPSYMVLHLIEEALDIVDKVLLFLGNTADTTTLLKTAEAEKDSANRRSAALQSQFDRWKTSRGEVEDTTIMDLVFD